MVPASDFGVIFSIWMAACASVETCCDGPIVPVVLGTSLVQVDECWCWCGWLEECCFVRKLRRRLRELVNASEWEVVNILKRLVKMSRGICDWNGDFEIARSVGFASNKLVLKKKHNRWRRKVFFSLLVMIYFKQLCNAKVSGLYISVLDVELEKAGKKHGVYAIRKKNACILPALPGAIFMQIKGTLKWICQSYLWLHCDI